MNPKKLKEKDRRRAKKLADQGWEAVDSGNLNLAEKIIRRAVAAQPDNPVLWDDQGVILGLCGKQAEASESFRMALSIAPTFAEPFAHLAAMRIRQGFIREAVALQAEAVRHAPDNVGYVERLEAYRSLAGESVLATSVVPPATSADRSEAVPAGTPSADWLHPLANVDWPQVAERLTRDGCALVPRLIDPYTCARLREMYDVESLFAKTVVMDRPEFGLGEYRYFRAPIPDAVDELRRAVYPHVSRIANHWQTLLGDPERFPEDWEAFREVCRRAGQSTPTPILLKYLAGGFNALHRDLRGAVFFPIQMAAVLNSRADAADPEPDSFQGGEFLFCDVPMGKKSRRREIAAGLGDAVFFCTRDRLVPVGGVYGLQPVKHGVSTITAGTRLVLGVPFHEYR
jgi:uncharacterized protein